MHQEQQPANAPQFTGAAPGGNSAQPQPGVQPGMQGGAQQGGQTAETHACSQDAGHDAAATQGGYPGTAGAQPQGMQPQGMQPQAMQPQGMQPQGMQPQGMQPQTHPTQTAPQGGPAMYMGAQPPQGHSHLLEHITGQPSSVGMMAAGATMAPMNGMQPGPNMGQPHFSHEMPGAAPYQGAPMAAQPGFAGQPGYTGQPGFAGQPGYAGQPGPVPGPATGQMYGQTPGQVFAQMPGQGFAPGYGQQPHPGSQPGYQPSGMDSKGMDSKGMENHYGELYGLINEAANGNADVNSFVRFFQSTSSDFWKGALVGTALTLLLTNDAVKSGIAKGFAGIWGIVGGKAEEMEAEEDRKAEEQMAKEQKA